jgi:hypothetical protein
MKVIERPTEKMKMAMFSADVGDKDYPRRSSEKSPPFSSLLVQWQTQPL